MEPTAKLGCESSEEDLTRLSSSPPSSASSVTVINVEYPPSPALSPRSKPGLNTTIEHCCATVKIDLNLTQDEKKGAALITGTATGMGGDNNNEPTVNPTKKAPSPNCCRRYLGIGLGLCSCIAFSLSALIVKSMPQYHSFSLALWRFIGVFLFSFPILIYYEKVAVKSVFSALWPLSIPENRKAFFSLVLRGVFGTTASVLLFCSLTYMEVADVTVISFSTPVFVTLVAFFMLGEKCGIVPIFTALLTLAGVVVIARPPFLTGAASFDFNLMMGTALSFGSMIFSTGVFVLLRYLRKLNFAVVTTSFGIIGMIQCAALCVIIGRFDVPQNSWDWILGSSIGILTFLGQLFLTSALKFESAGSISLIRTCDVIFAFLWQLIFLNVWPDEYSCIGALVVISGVLIVAFRKWLDELEESNPIRRKLWFVLK